MSTQQTLPASSVPQTKHSSGSSHTIFDFINYPVDKNDTKRVQFHGSSIMQFINALQVQQKDLYNAFIKEVLNYIRNHVYEDFAHYSQAIKELVDIETLSDDYYLLDINKYTHSYIKENFADFEKRINNSPSFKQKLSIILSICFPINEDDKFKNIRICFGSLVEFFAGLIYMLYYMFSSNLSNTVRVIIWLLILFMNTLSSYLHNTKIWPFPILYLVLITLTLLRFSSNKEQNQEFIEFLGNISISNDNNNTSIRIRVPSSALSSSDELYSLLSIFVGTIAIIKSCHKLTKFSF